MAANDTIADADASAMPTWRSIKIHNSSHKMTRSIAKVKEEALSLNLKK